MNREKPIVDSIIVRGDATTQPFESILKLLDRYYDEDAREELEPFKQILSQCQFILDPEFTLSPFKLTKHDLSAAEKKRIMSRIKSRKMSTGSHWNVSSEQFDEILALGVLVHYTERLDNDKKSSVALNERCLKSVKRGYANYLRLEEILIVLGEKSFDKRLNDFVASNYEVARLVIKAHLKASTSNPFDLNNIKQDWRNMCVFTSSEASSLLRSEARKLLILVWGSEGFSLEQKKYFSAALPLKSPEYFEYFTSNFYKLFLVLEESKRNNGFADTVATEIVNTIKDKMDAHVLGQRDISKISYRMTAWFNSISSTFEVGEYLETTNPTLRRKNL